jgi:hypothetical protein
MGVDFFEDVLTVAADMRIASPRVDGENRAVRTGFGDRLTKSEIGFCVVRAEFDKHGGPCGVNQIAGERDVPEPTTDAIRAAPDRAEIRRRQLHRQHRKSFALHRLAQASIDVPIIGTDRSDLFCNSSLHYRRDFPDGVGLMHPGRSVSRGRFSVAR